MLNSLQSAIIGSLEFVMLNLLCHGRWDAAKARKEKKGGIVWVTMEVLTREAGLLKTV
jgi:hypothetical protein